MQKKRGRPPKNPAERKPRERRQSVMLPLDTHATLAELAARLKRSKGDVVVAAIEWIARQNQVIQLHVVGALGDGDLDLAEIVSALGKGFQVLREADGEPKGEGKRSVR